jgi:E3 ubiquitin-protein ligase makorin
VPQPPAALFVSSAAEAQASAGRTCGVCLEDVLARGARFGILTGCDHCVCLPCIQAWRATHAIRPEVARTCPECRALSHFVVPSHVFVTHPERKALLVRGYQGGLGKIPCKHFAFGEGTCPFGTSCFYAHVDRAGNPLSMGGPRRVGGADGARVVKTYTIADHLFGASDDVEQTRRVLEAIPLSSGDG